MESGADCSRRSKARGFPLARQEFGNGFHWVIQDPSDDVHQVGLGVDALPAAVFHQREQIGQAGPGVRVPDVAPVSRAELQWPDTLLDEIIFDSCARFGQAAHQRSLLAEQIAKRLPQARLGRHAGNRRQRIGKEFVGQRATSLSSQFGALFLGQLKMPREAFDPEELIIETRLIG